nr:MAG TPA: hypothetical protein [Caudoviricetes sp.]
MSIVVLRVVLTLNNINAKSRPDAHTFVPRNRVAAGDAPLLSNLNSIHP